MSSAYDKVKIARNIKRPTSLDFINNIFDNFIEFAGDRTFRDDKAIVGGIATINKKPVTVIGIQKGQNLEDNIKTNFGQVHPEGYRKALRLMKQGEKFNRPIICFINTAGAFCGKEAEERGQGEAIAKNLLEMSTLKVPIISIITGEGGSGGALALAVADNIIILENAVYSVLSPEGFSSILWKSNDKASDVATLMKLTASDLLDLKIVDKIISEPSNGLENNADLTYDLIKVYILKTLYTLCKLDSEELICNRYDRFRNFGMYT